MRSVASVCLSVCLSACPVCVQTRESLDQENVFLARRISRPSSYIKVIWSRSRSQEQ